MVPERGRGAPAVASNLARPEGEHEEGTAAYTPDCSSIERHPRPFLYVPLQRKREAHAGQLHGATEVSHGPFLALKGKHRARLQAVGS